MMGMSEGVLIGGESAAENVVPAPPPPAAKARIVPPGISVAAMMIAVILGIAALRFAESFLLPIAVAGVLALVLTPIARAFERLHMPSGLAAVVAVALAACGILYLGGLAAPTVSTFVDQAPKLAKQIEKKLNPIIDPIKKQIVAVESASQRLNAAASPTPTPRASAPASAQSEQTSLIHKIIGLAPDVFASILFILILTIFFIALRRQYRAALIRLPRTRGHRLRMARVMRDVQRCASGYLFDMLCINVGMGIVTFLALLAVHSDAALMWAIVFPLANFVPVLGPASVVFVSAAWGFATEPDIPSALVVPAIILAIHTVEANLVEPLTYARRIQVSPLVIFLSVTFFLWLWGVPGSLVAIPILIVFYTASRHFPALRPAYVLMSQAPERRAICPARSERSKIQRAVQMTVGTAQSQSARG